jgi:hypothetical protein
MEKQKYRFRILNFNKKTKMVETFANCRTKLMTKDEFKKLLVKEAKKSKATTCFEVL